MSSNVSVNNLLSEMTNALKQDPANVNLVIPVPGRKVAVIGNTQVIDSVTPLPLDKHTTHISWSVQVDGIFVTFDGSDPTLAASPRHAIAVGNLGTVWNRQLAESARVAPQAGAPIFVITEVTKK